MVWDIRLAQDVCGDDGAEIFALACPHKKKTRSVGRRPDDIAFWRIYDAPVALDLLLCNFVYSSFVDS